MKMNDISKLQAEDTACEGQIGYYLSAVTDYRGMTDEKIKQLISHYDARLKIKDKIIASLMKDLNEKEDKK